MDFKKMLETAKNKTKEASDKAIKYSSEKLAESSLTLKKPEEVQKIIDSSKNTKFKNKEGVEKTFTKNAIILFGDAQSDFFKDALYVFPVLATKGFSKSISVKMAGSDIKDFDYEKNEIKEFPSLVFYENTKVKKIVTGKENILKLVKSLNLDINTEIEKM